MKLLPPEQARVILANELTSIISGLRSGSIKSKPIMLISEEAENYEMISLERSIWKTLNKCGFYEPGTEPKPTKPKTKKKAS